MNTKGLEGLPLKLLIVALLMSLSAPIVVGSIDRYGREVDRASIRSIALEIKDAAQTMFMAGAGNSRSVDVDLPPSTWMEIGGGVNSIDSFSIRCFRGEEMVAREWMEDPPFRLVSSEDQTSVRGSFHLLLKCVQWENRMVVMVEVEP